MENKQPSIIDLLIETHIGLKRQGPGSSEATYKALSFLDGIDQFAQTVDLGCGTGGQTLLLSQHLPGEITGIDLFPDFIDVFHKNVQEQNLEGRVKGIVGSMDDLTFAKNSLDLIWSEGAIDNIGFEKGLSYWRSFLKEGGYVAVTCPSWITHEKPEEVERFWSDAGSRLDSVEENISAMQRCGYQYVASFVLPEQCWTENYFIPREAAIKSLLEKYAGNETAKEFAERNQYEVELYSKYCQHYGYVFYIGRAR